MYIYLFLTPFYLHSDHTTPYHYEPHEDPLMFLEYLRDIELPEQQQPENPQPLGNNSDSEAIFITGPHIPVSECLPSDFSNVFEYSLSDFNINDIPTIFVYLTFYN